MEDRKGAVIGLHGVGATAGPPRFARHLEAATEIMTERQRQAGVAFLDRVTKVTAATGATNTNDVLHVIMKAADITGQTPDECLQKLEAVVNAPDFKVVSVAEAQANINQVFEQKTKRFPASAVFKNRKARRAEEKYHRLNKRKP